MRTPGRATEFEEMINRAMELQRKGEYGKSLKILKEAEEKPASFSTLPIDEINLLHGLICHHQGRILQAMGKFNEAIEKLQKAIELRKGDPVQYGYSIFQLYICKDYAGIKISDREVRDTTIALLKMADASNDSKQLGDIFQNLAYIKQKQENTEQAVWFYQIAEMFRVIAKDERGLNLTWARLAECYKILGLGQETGKCGKKALDYFESVGDVERVQQIKRNVFGHGQN